MLPIFAVIATIYICYF